MKSKTDHSETQICIGGYHVPVLEPPVAVGMFMVSAWAHKSLSVVILNSVEPDVWAFVHDFFTITQKAPTDEEEMEGLLSKRKIIVAANVYYLNRYISVTVQVRVTFQNVGAQGIEVRNERGFELQDKNSGAWVAGTAVQSSTKRCVFQVSIMRFRSFGS